MLDGVEQVGLILVHGIGEQRRFGHLDSTVRPLLEAFEQRCGKPACVEIETASADENLAGQASWGAGTGPNIRIHAELDGRKLCVNVHEVWWADVNEPRSIVKQIRFWRWGLGVWFLPPKRRSKRKLAKERMWPARPSGLELWLARIEIYLVSAFFVGFSLTVGLFFEALRRVVEIKTPDIVGAVTNYLSSIKLYHQKRRLGASLDERVDFLDTLGEPPRTSIRRRMVRVIADMVSRKYDRWYIFAHSLGSVVAFNALMEPAYVFPSYLDEARWNALRGACAGGKSATPCAAPKEAPKDTIPARRPWLEPDDVAFRPIIFKNFRGLLTYGSPIGKFTAIWPSLVPICREPAFGQECVWINAYDPLDPVGGPARHFNGEPPTNGGFACWPKKNNIGVRAGDILLQAHLDYLNPSKAKRDGSRVDRLADRLVNWLSDPGYGSDRLIAHNRNIGLKTGAMAWRWVVMMVQVLFVSSLVEVLFVSLAVNFIHTFERAYHYTVFVLNFSWPDLTWNSIPSELPIRMWSGCMALWELWTSDFRLTICVALVPIVLPLIFGLITRIRPDTNDKDADNHVLPPEDRKQILEDSPVLAPID